MFKRLATLSAAVLLAAVPVFAHDHGEEHGKMEAGQCPHHQAVTAAVDQAMALLDAALAEKDPAAMTAKVTEARKQLTDAKVQMEQCKEMCSKMMGHGEGHSGMMNHGAMLDHGCKGMATAEPAKALAKVKAKLDKDPEGYLKAKSEA